MRSVTGTILAVLIGLAAGCGKSDSPTENKNPTENPKPGGTTTVPVDPPKDGIPPKTDGNPAPPMTPVTPAAAWEMDPAKHTIPATPATGKLANAAFTPETSFEGDTLIFRMLKDGLPEREITLKFSAAQTKAAADGLKLVVKPDQAPGPDVPTLLASFPPAKAGEPTIIEFQNGYALTLELAKRTGATVTGKIYLCLPRDEKDFLAGTFTAEWIRPASELPGPDDAPYIQGKLTVPGAMPTTQVKVGYAGEPKAGDFALDSVQMPFIGMGSWARSAHTKPRASVLVGTENAAKPGRYEHTRLPAGRYLVYAGVAGGPLAWKWVTLPAGGKLDVDFTLDSTKSGKLEVTVPAGTTGKVQLAPAEDAGMTVPANLFFTIASFLELEVEPKSNVASFDKLGPGRYEVKAGGLSDSIEVKAGETVKLELKKK